MHLDTPLEFMLAVGILDFPPRNPRWNPRWYSKLRKFPALPVTRGLGPISLHPQVFENSSDPSCCSVWQRNHRSTKSKGRQSTKIEFTRLSLHSGDLL